MDADRLKPSFEEWMYWTQVVIDRLRDVVGVYSRPPFPDVFMAEDERQFKLSQTTASLRQLHGTTDEDDLARIDLDSEAVAKHDERVIASLPPLFRDILRRLPSLSGDMQTLLKSPWLDNCTGRTATQIFRGPEGRENEGIGSGHPVHGRLPLILENLLEREQMGDLRTPRTERPTKEALQREDLARRWGRRNSTFLRSAGRMD